MKAYLLDAEPLMRKGESGVRLFLKTPQGKSLSAFAPFEPYFYLLPASGDLQAVAKKVEALKAVTRGNEARVKRIEIVEKNLFGKTTELLKVACFNPGHVPALREECKPFGQVFEHAIPFARRFVIDSGLVPESLVEWGVEGRTVRHYKQLPHDEALASMPPLRTLAFDIETRTVGGVPNPQKEPCIMISYAIGDGGEESGVITFAKDHTSKKFVKQVKDEKQMLEEFARLVREKKIDLLCGYNSDEFDLPYLMERAKQVKAEFNLSRSKNGKIVLKKLGLRRRARVSGRIHYDVFNTASRLNFIGAFKFPRLTLGAVYAALTGEEKLDTKKMEIWKAWDAGGDQLNHLLEYSLADAIACRKVMEFTLPLDIAAARVTRMTLFDVSRATPGQLVESLLMRRSFERNEVVPNKPDFASVQARQNDAIKGGYVKVPSPGVYENIAVFDFRSLYPSIIVSHDIDPATLNCDCCPGEEAHVAPTGARFCRKKRGLVPETLEKVLDERSALKSELKKLGKDGDDYKQLDARQWALKILANSIAADEPLVLLNPANEVVVKTASEFVDPLLGDEFLWTTQLGNAPGWKAVSFNALGTMEFKPISKVMRHACKSMLSLNLSSGREVKITKDHSVFSLNDEGEIIPVAGCDLKPGSPVIVPKKMPSPDLKIERLNLAKGLSAVPENELNDVVVTLKLKRHLDALEIDSLVLDGVNGTKNISEIARGSNIGGRTAGQHLKYLLKQGMVHKFTSGRAFVYSLTEKARDFQKFVRFSRKLAYNGNKREHFAFFNKVRDEICELTEPYLNEVKIGALNGTRIPVFIPFNEETASLIGYYASEGRSRKWLNRTKGYSYRVDITNYDQKVLDAVFEAFQKLGFKPNRSAHHVCVNNKCGYLIFKHLLKCGENAYQKSIPSAILSGTQELKWAFLKSYFDGDGNYEKKAKRWRFTTVSRRLATDLTILLNQMGIAGVSIKRDSKIYGVVVNEPLFSGVRKLYRTFAFNIPGKMLEKEITALGKKEFLRHLKSGMNAKALQKFYSAYKAVAGESKKIERLSAFLETDLAVDKILNIREETPTGYVYDLSVEGNENFVGGSGLICLHNSTYGYLVYARSRYYSRDCGEAITAFARFYIQQTIEKAEQTGFRVLYSDTDSCFLLLEDKTREDALKFKDKINAELPGRMELELEDFYPRGIFVSKKHEKEERGAKKKYALINDAGAIKIRGFELVRRDWSTVARNTQRQVLEILLKEGDLKKALELVRQTVGELREGKVALADCAIRTQLRKSAASYEVVSPELSAMRKAREKGVRVEEHALIEYVITKQGKTVSDKAQLLELAKDYDADYYINNQVLPAVLKILGALGVSEDDIKTKSSQKSLGEW